VTVSRTASCGVHCLPAPSVQQTDIPPKCPSHPTSYSHAYIHLNITQTGGHTDAYKHVVPLPHVVGPIQPVPPLSALAVVREESRGGERANVPTWQRSRSWTWRQWRLRRLSAKRSRIVNLPYPHPVFLRTSAHKSFCWAFQWRQFLKRCSLDWVLYGHYRQPLPEARCKLPFALRAGLSQEDTRRTKETTEKRQNKRTK